jgi:anti-anti-sigma factor
MVARFSGGPTSGLPSRSVPIWGGAVECVVSRTVGGCPVVAVTGELDQAAAARLRAEVFEAVTSSPVVVVDLSQVSRTDLAGIGALALCSYAADKLGGQLRIAAAGPEVWRVAAVTGATTRLRMYGTVSAAVRAATV